MFSFAFSSFLSLALFIATSESAPRLPSNFNVIPRAEFSSPIVSRVQMRESKLERLRQLKRADGADIFKAGSNFNVEYLVNATIGGSTVSLLLDTGSSDTFVAKKDFKCFDSDNNSTEVPQAQCGFVSTFDPSISKTFEPIPNESWHRGFVDGDFFKGVPARETVTIGDLTVPQQEIAVVDQAAWDAGNIYSGYLGLSYNSLTRFSTNTSDGVKPNTKYTSVPFSAVDQGILKNPIFSIALNRVPFDKALVDDVTTGLGLLSWGGIAPVPVTETQATAPVQRFAAGTFNASNATDAVYRHFAVPVQAFSFPGAKDINSFVNATIIDTGIPLNAIPDDVANDFAAAVSPPATYLEDKGLFQVDCKATIPEFHVRIHDETFTVDPKDNIKPFGKDDSGNQVCILGTTRGGNPSNTNLFILGDPFLGSVVATYNVKSNEITFTQRAKY